MTTAGFLETQYLHNSLLDWGLALLGFLAPLVLLPFVRSLIRARQDYWRRLSTHSSAVELLSQLLHRTSRIVLLIAGLYIAEKTLTLPKRVDLAFDIIIVVGTWFQGGLWATAALKFFIQHRQGSARLHDTAAKNSLGVVTLIAQILIWSLFALLALDNLGVNITTLVAGLGVGGIALALAVQTLLGDLLASISIAFDKPFEPGDLLKLDDFEGTVEAIGIKSTRLRSLTGEQIIITNADLLKSRLRNLGRMPERRSLFRLYVAYDTPAVKVAAVPDIVESAVRGIEGTRFVSCLLASLGRDALEFEVLFFVENRPGIDIPRANAAVNQQIVARFAAEGIGFAYPTQRRIA
ncbi:MAG: hypothetical protein RLZZ200_1099 [Pseudomonadota bacterium]